MCITTFLVFSMEFGYVTNNYMCQLKHDQNISSKYSSSSIVTIQLGYNKFIEWWTIFAAIEGLENVDGCF